MSALHRRKKKSKSTARGSSAQVRIEAPTAVPGGDDTEDVQRVLAIQRLKQFEKNMHHVVYENTRNESKGPLKVDRGNDRPVGLRMDSDDHDSEPKRGHRRGSVFGGGQVLPSEALPEIHGHPQAKKPNRFCRYVSRLIWQPLVWILVFMGLKKAKRSSLDPEHMHEAPKQKVKWYMIDPRSKVKTAWDALIFLMVVYTCIEVPYDLVFDLEGQILAFFVMNWVIVAFFSVDIVLTFFTCREDRKRRVLITSLVKISKKYILRGELFLDLVATFPFELLWSGLKLLRMLRVVRLYRLAIYVMHRVNRPGFRPLFINAIYPIAWLTFGIHWVGCIWASILTEDQVQDEDMDTYLRAIYWTVTTITTVGYGDITPENNGQYVMSIFVMIMGVGLYAYLIGRASDSVVNLDRGEAEKRERMNLLNAYMRYRKYPKHLQKQVWEYHIFQWDNMMSEGFFGPVLEMLSPGMRRLVSSYETKALMDKCEMLSSLKTETKRSFSQELQALVLTPGQYVFQHGDDDTNIYFVDQGMILVQDPHTGETLSRCGEGDVFGFVELKSTLFESMHHSQRLRGFNAVAEHYTVVYSISLDAVSQALTDSAFHVKLAEKIDEFQTILLKKMEVLCDFEETEIQELAAGSTVLVSGSNEPLYLEGEVSEDVYMLYSGQCVRVDVPTGKNYVLESGDIIGDVETMLNIERLSGVLTKKFSVMFKFRARNFRKIVLRNSKFRALVYRSMLRKKDSVALHDESHMSTLLNIAGEEASDIEDTAQDELDDDAPETRPSSPDPEDAIVKTNKDDDTNEEKSREVESSEYSASKLKLLEEIELEAEDQEMKWKHVHDLQTRLKAIDEKMRELEEEKRKLSQSLVSDIGELSHMFTTSTSKQRQLMPESIRPKQAKAKARTVVQRLMLAQRALGASGGGGLLRAFKGAKLSSSSGPPESAKTGNAPPRSNFLALIKSSMDKEDAKGGDNNPKESEEKPVEAEGSASTNDGNATLSSSSPDRSHVTAGDYSRDREHGNEDDAEKGGNDRHPPQREKPSDEMAVEITGNTSVSPRHQGALPENEAILAHSVNNPPLVRDPSEVTRNSEEQL